MSLRVYNTMTKSKEEFIPAEKNKVKFYVCGPTVYDFFHIGNARCFVIFDVIRRYLEYKGYDVTYVQNITDVDDKIINRAREDGVDAREIAERYTEAFFEDIEKLGIRRADYHPKATDHIGEMIEIVERLIEKGYAYVLDGDVYYDVTKFKDYGKLSGKKLDELMGGARVEVDPRKRNPGDFALWKSSKPGEPSWESPWGPGRPGWHIECSIMSMKYLGETIDIHAGGADLIFPHHENEIAQSEAATGKPFVKYWLHNGFLNIGGEKMSKSLGNFFTARDVLKKYDPEVIRFFFLSKHYRHPIDFSEENLKEAEEGLNKFYTVLQNIDSLTQQLDESGERIGSADQRLEEVVNNLPLRFAMAMDDDFNTAAAIGELFNFIREINIYLSGGNKNKELLLDAQKLIRELGAILGIFQRESKVEDIGLVKDLMNLIVEIRARARAERNWNLADYIRSRLNELNIQLEDRKDGITIWRRI
ncbi:MAG: cysteine--tRNA ligase [bacterium]